MKEINHNSQIGFKVWKQKTKKTMKVSHTHSDIEINFMINGELTYLSAYGRETIRAGQAFAFWGGLPHKTISKSDDSEGIWITLPISWVLQSNISENSIHDLFKGLYLRDSDKERDPFRYHQFSLWLEDYESQKIELHRIIQIELEAYLSRLGIKQNENKKRYIKHTGPQDKIIKITQYLNKNYIKDIKIDSVAKHIDLHPKYLSSLFKSTYGMSLWGYITQLRIAHAQHLLAMTSKSVTEISYASGFNSVAPFYQAFKKYCSDEKPLSYRKKCKSI